MKESCNRYCVIKHFIYSTWDL